MGDLIVTTQPVICSACGGAKTALECPDRNRCLGEPMPPHQHFVCLNLDCARGWVMRQWYRRAKSDLVPGLSADPPPSARSGRARNPVPDCPHPSPVGFLTWDGAYLTLDGRERQLSQWCPDCGALGLWSKDGDRVEWVRPGVLGEMPDCSAQDAPRTPFRDPGAGVVAGTEGEALLARADDPGPMPHPNESTDEFRARLEPDE